MLTTQTNYATIASALNEQRNNDRVGELSPCEAQTILLMRAIQKRRNNFGLVLVAFLGNAWRVYETDPPKFIT